VLGVIPKTARRDARSDRLGFCRDQGIDAAPLEGAVDLRVRISGIGRNCLNVDLVVAMTSSTWGAIISPSFFSPVVTSTSRGHAHIVVNGRVLLVTKLKVSVARVCGHRRVRIGHANFLVLAALPTLLFDLNANLVEHLDHMTLDKALPADVGSDEGSVNVYDLTGRDLGLQTGLNPITIGVITFESSRPNLNQPRFKGASSDG
jgi:hypothetical protein